MTRHQRLSRNMRSPARAARRAKKLRRQAKFADGRPAEYRAHRLPESWLRELYGAAYATQRPASAAVTRATINTLLRHVAPGRKGAASHAAAHASRRGTS